MAFRNSTKAHLVGVTAGAADLDSDAVESAKIKDLAVTTGKINNLAVTAGKIATSAVTTGKIGDAAVTVTKLNSQSVSTAKIVDAAVVTDKLNSQAVTTAKIAANAVTATELNSQAVSNAKLADNAVTAGKVNSQAVGRAALSAPYSINVVSWGKIGAWGNTASGANATGVFHMQAYGATEIVEVGVAAGTIPTSGTLAIQVQRGASAATYTSILAAALSVAAAGTPAVAAPSGTLGTVADNHFVRVAVTTCGSSAADVGGWLVLKQYHVA